MSKTPAEIQVPSNFQKDQYTAYTQRLDELYEKMEDYSNDETIEVVRREAEILQNIIYQLKL